MSDAATVSFAADCMHVAGGIDFASVVALEREGEAWLRSQAPVMCRVDLGAVSSCNSAGTALLVSWLRTAAAAGKTLSIERVPPGLGALLHLGGLDELLQPPIRSTPAESVRTPPIGPPEDGASSADRREN